jgi:predicted GH43/DUF377 family glycosyl hydrolase
MRKFVRKRKLKNVPVSVKRKEATSVLERFDGNPILEPLSNHWWESKAAFNPAAIRVEGKTHIVYRAIGNSDVSVLGYASSIDGFHIEERLDTPTYVPREPFEGTGLMHPTVSNPQVTYVSAEDEEEKEENYISGGGGWKTPD